MPSLEASVRETECALVVTQPDRPAGRGHKLTPTPVKRRALELGLAVAEPPSLRDFAPVAARLQPDLFVVASFGRIVPATLLDVPSRAALNVHPSLLPRYRGATPLQSQLRDGVAQGGVTIIHMDAGMDTGDIALQLRVPIGPLETYGELHDRLARDGAVLLVEAIALLRADALPRVPQRSLASGDEIARTLTRPLRKADLEIDWEWSAQRIVDAVRALAPEPLARARFEGVADPVKLVSARTGSQASADALVVPCGPGRLERVAIERVVPPNRGAMAGAAFARALAAR